MLVGTLFLLSVTFANAEDILDPPLGVPFNRASLYKERKEFMCLDGSKTIMYSQVNDDYCDCPDGSDEPGTSACPNGQFYCNNKGHKGGFMPSSRVNDRICDCCDGSDEYNGAVTCVNICDELGRSAREERERQSAVAKKGFAVRQTLAAEGQKIKKEKVDEVIPLKASRDELLPRKDALLAEKKTLEEREQQLTNAHKDKWNAEKEMKLKAKAAELFKELDTNNDAKISLNEVQNLEYLDDDHDGVVSETEAKLFLPTEDIDFEAFKDGAYKTLKSAKAGYLDRKKLEAAKDTDDLVAEEDKAEDHSEESEDHEDEDEVMPAYDEETQKAIDEAEAHRRKVNDLDREIGDIDSKIRDAEAFTSQDFGHDFAWAPLKGQCFDLNDMQYTYKLCPFDKTVQKDKNGYGETSLGNFKDWTGAGPRKYSAQNYEDGQQCWNGPKRSTKVVIECGEENKLMSASEPAKCEYEFVFQTPAACNDPDKEEPIHTEL